jgi:hypothetical protein
MKTVIKLLVLLAILNATARVALAASSYYQLKDASLEILTFGAQSPIDDLAQNIYRKAQTLQVPLGLEGVRVSREGPRTSAAATYTQPVEVFPSFVYPVKFSFSVDAISMAGLGPAPTPRR